MLSHTAGSACPASHQHRRHAGDFSDCLSLMCLDEGSVGWVLTFIIKQLITHLAPTTGLWFCWAPPKLPGGDSPLFQRAPDTLLSGSLGTVSDTQRTVGSGCEGKIAGVVLGGEQFSLPFPSPTVHTHSRWGCGNKNRKHLFLPEVEWGSTKGSDLQWDYAMRSVFHSCYGYLVVSVNTTVYLGPGYEDASKKCCVIAPVLTPCFKISKKWG